MDKLFEGALGMIMIGAKDCGKSEILSCLLDQPGERIEKKTSTEERLQAFYPKYFRTLTFLEDNAAVFI